MQGEVKVILSDGGIKVGISPSLAGNHLLVLGLLDVAREQIHAQVREQQVRPATPALVRQLTGRAGES